MVGDSDGQPNDFVFDIGTAGTYFDDVDFTVGHPGTVQVSAGVSLDNQGSSTVRVTCTIEDASGPVADPLALQHPSSVQDVPAGSRATIPVGAWAQVPTVSGTDRYTVLIHCASNANAVMKHRTSYIHVDVTGGAG